MRIYPCLNKSSIDETNFYRKIEVGLIKVNFSNKMEVGVKSHFTLLNYSNVLNAVLDVGK